MKIVHAIWEQRNLGVNCYEVLVERGDTPTTLQERASEYETEYTVVKVPPGMMDVSLYLQGAGYSFIELITVCHHAAALPQLTRIQRRSVDSVTCEEMDEADRDALLAHVREGMFEDDRVSLDPYFTADQANNRYLGWIGDETTQGGRLYKLVYKGGPAGFFTLRDRGGGVLVANLGGIYPDYRRHGFGLCMNYQVIAEANASDARRVVSSFSSNNRGASAIHLALGYILDSQYYVFVAHKH